MQGSLHRELLEKWGAEVMAGAAVLLRKVVSLTDRAQYVNNSVLLLLLLLCVSVF